MHHDHQATGGRFLPRFRHATCGGELVELARSARCTTCGATGGIRPLADDEGEPYLELVDQGTYLEAVATFALLEGEPDPSL